MWCVWRKCRVQDIAAMDAAMEKLNTAWTAASQDMYNAQQPEGGANGAAGEGASASSSDTKEDVTDVDYEEVK